jgi:DNA repair ATPase RecN
MKRKRFLTLPPEMEALGDVDRRFLHVLIQAREAKTAICYKALGTLFEMDQLEQAIAGANNPLGTSCHNLQGQSSNKCHSGTKLHQRTLKSIQKRQPALEKLIRRYNEHCATLKAMYKPAYRIPLLQALSDNLYQVREDSYLLENVIVSQTPEQPSQWYTESTVRSGVRALLKLDRCTEEESRLPMEA